MSDGDYASAEHYLAAIRMAIEGSSNGTSALAVIEKIAEAGPKCEPSDLWPTRILVDAIHASNAFIRVCAE